jgi:hypothetical protein
LAGWRHPIEAGDGNGKARNLMQWMSRVADVDTMINREHQHHENANVKCALFLSSRRQANENSGEQQTRTPHSKRVLELEDIAMALHERLPNNKTINSGTLFLINRFII